MTGVKTAMMKAAMTGLYHTGAHRLLAPYTQGSGVIFTLHHVRPESGKAFAPNRILEVTPEFLEAVLDQVEAEGLDVVDLDEAARRLKEDDPRRFACFTFDDGYRDNRDNAYPIFKRRGLPLTIYVPTDYPSGKGELWWIALEEIVARADEIELCRNGDLWRLPSKTIAEKWRTYDQIYWWLRAARRSGAAADRPYPRRALRDRHGCTLPRPDHGLGRDPRACSRPARHHRRPHQGTLRRGEAPARKGGRRNAGERGGD